MTHIDDIPGRFPNLGKLSVALIEHLVKPVIGDKAIAEIQQPLLEKKLREKLAAALQATEDRFRDTAGEPEIKAALLDAPVATLPSLQRAALAFYRRPTDSSLERLLTTELVNLGLPKDEVTASAKAYLNLARQEMALIDPEVRDKIGVLALLKISEVLDRENTRSFDDLIETHVRPLVQHQTAGNRSGATRIVWAAPPVPSLFLGRDKDLLDLKERLTVGQKVTDNHNIQILTALHGWPGIGKTTLAAALAHDEGVLDAFPDGVLWVSLGEEPKQTDGILGWARALGFSAMGRPRSLQEISGWLSSALQTKRMLLVIDDVWEPEHAEPFRVGGRHCATLVTTRVQQVAITLAPAATNVFRLDVLDEQASMELFTSLAPGAVTLYRDKCIELLRVLDGLPLAIQVAGRLLHSEMSRGLGVAELLDELAEGKRIIEALAPSDRSEVAQSATPTVSALLAKSTDYLGPDLRRQFVQLCVFAPRPATFDLAAMSAVWQVEDPRPFVRILVDRGLLEFIGERYRIHSVIVAHARSLVS